MRVFISTIFLFFTCYLIGQAPQLIVQRGHNAPITDMIVSPSLQLLATTSYDKTIKVWDVSTGKELRTYLDVSQDFSPIRLALGYEEQFFFSSSTNGSVLKFSFLEKEYNQLLPPSDKVISFMKVHPSRPLLAIGHETGEVILYDYEMEEEIFNWQVGESIIQNIQFGERGRFIFAKAEKGEFLAFDLRKEEAKTSFPQNVQTFDISPDDKQIIVITLDSLSSIYKIKKGELVQTEKVKTNCRNVYWENESKAWIINENFQLETLNINEATTIPADFNLPRYYALKIENGQLLVNDGPELKIFNLNTFKAVQSYKGFVGDVYTSNINVVLFDKKGRNLITAGGKKSIRFWGEYNYQDLPIGFEIKKLKRSEDGKWLLCSGSNKKFHLIDIAQRKIVQTYTGHKKSLMNVAFLQNNRIVSVARDKTVKVWNRDSASVLHDWKRHKGYIYSVATHKNIIATGDSKGIIYLWDTQKGEMIDSVDKPKSVVYQLLFSPNGEYLYASFDDGTLMKWNWQNRTTSPIFQRYNSQFPVLKYFQDSLYAIQKSTNPLLNEMAIVSVQMDSQIMTIPTFYELENGINDFHWSDDGRFLVSAGSDNTVKLWDLTARKRLGRIYTLGQGNWAIGTPNGLFDASNEGMKLMHYTELNEAIQLDQLKERYYEPDLLQKLLGYNDEPLRNPTAFKAIDLYPRADLFMRNLDLSIQLTPRSGGIGKVSLFINQKEILEDINADRKGYIDIDLTPYTKFFLNDTINKIGIKVYNEEGWLHSRLQTIDYKYTSKARTASNKNSKKLNLNKKKYQPHFYALIIGTSNYRGEVLDLTFADKDAADIANALNLAGSKLFGEARTHVKLLNTEQHEDAQPSKMNIQEAFQSIGEQANAEDIFVLYLAGHGVNYGAPNSQFYYLTKEIASEELSDESIRNNYTYSSSEFTAALKNISAQKQIMMLDACSSGSLVENVLSQSRSLSSSQKRALDRMKDRAGVFILAGSAANKVSYEASQFGQGLLTYSLLSGMRGGALRENEFVDVMQLFQYAADKVPELAAVIGGVQRPVIAAPTSTNSFDIGQITDSVRYQIPLEEVKPLFIKSNFQHETRYEDILDLGDRIDDTFQALSRDSDASILFINVKKYPKAYSIKGRYDINENGQIVLKAKLFQDGNAIGNIETQGQGEENLIEQVLEKVVGLIE